SISSIPLRCSDEGGRALPSFPTRRSSDLGIVVDEILFYAKEEAFVWNPQTVPIKESYVASHFRNADADGRKYKMADILAKGAGRSEEHTSELQSRFDLVCRLLLEKKKQPHRAERLLHPEQQVRRALYGLVRLRHEHRLPPHPYRAAGLAS